MSTIWIQKFRDGIDARRLPETTNSGALIRAVDGHITRGGEFEKRAAFVPTYTLPAGTVSLAATADSIYVFGSAATPVGLPAGVSYRRLQRGVDTLEQVVSWDLFEGEIYAVAQFSSQSETQHFFGTSEVLDRNGAGARASIFFIGGSAGDTADVFVNGVSATGGPVAWAVSDVATVEAIAAAINSTVSVPDYVAFSSSNTLVLSAADIATGAGRVSFVSATGGFTALSSNFTLSGGHNPVLQGTRFTRTIGTKEYTLSGAHLQFSAVGNPRDWSFGAGFGFIDTSSYTSGSDDLTAIEEFRDAAAAFSQRTIQIWQLQADPAENRLRQVLRNTGTSCPKSITQFGDGNIFYLDESGLRSLRARDSSSAAATYDVGSRADPLIVAKLRSMTEAERANVVGLIEPVTGNFWLIMKDTIFVYAYFEEEKVSGWTTYLPGFTVTDAVVFDRRVYLRSGDTIYVYGGLETGQETDQTEAEMWTAYQDGDDPATTKTWQAFDAAVSGEWDVSVGISLRDTDVAEVVAEPIDATTYNDERMGVVGRSTHASLRFRSRGTGSAIVGACALHYEADGGADAAASGWAAPEAADPNAWAPYGGGDDLATARVWHRRGRSHLSSYAQSVG